MGDDDWIDSDLKPLNELDEKARLKKLGKDRDKCEKKVNGWKAKDPKKKS